MQEKYKALEYPIRLALARALKECVGTWEKISEYTTLDPANIQNAKDNVAYYSRHLAAVEATL